MSPQTPNKSFQQAAEISLEKKRARDRRAQQNVRNKRNCHIITLQQELADRDARIQELLRTCQELRWRIGYSMLSEKLYLHVLVHGKHGRAIPKS